MVTLCFEYDGATALIKTQCWSIFSQVDSYSQVERLDHEFTSSVWKAALQYRVAVPAGLSLVNWIQCSFLMVQVIWMKLVQSWAALHEHTGSWWQMPSLQYLGQKITIWVLHPKCYLVSAVSFRYGCLFQWSCTFIIGICAWIALCYYE